MLTDEQNRAAAQLLEALNKCHVAGLRGGVYDEQFCLWPIDRKLGHDFDFFINVDEHGQVLCTQMQLDGGACP